MKKTLLLGLAVLTLGTLAHASPWSVRVRATYLETVDHSKPFTALGLNFGSGAVKVSNKLIPEIDIAYAFTDTLRAELVLTVPQYHTVHLEGAGRLGGFKHLPPTLLLQYHALPGRALRPYVGAGVNFTLIFDDDLSVAGVPLKLDNYSVNFAAQAGLDYTLNDTWALNLDIKRVLLRTDVSAGGVPLTEARLDPWLFSLGLRYSF